MIMKTNSVNVINLTNYRKIIKLAAEKFSQVCFEDLSVDLDRFMLWRHDVDIDLARASKIAEIDESEGFRSCFFLNISSEFYNLHDFKSQEILNQIFSSGHELGVHLFIGKLGKQVRVDLFSGTCRKQYIFHFADDRVRFGRYHGFEIIIQLSFKERRSQ